MPAYGSSAAMPNRPRRQPALGSPNGAAPRTGRLHPQATKHPAQHRTARRSQTAARATFSADTIGQNHYATGLGRCPACNIIRTSCRVGSLGVE
jgi:hypothetical protein